MADLWTRRASFLSGLFAALMASLGIAAADVVAGLIRQGEPLSLDRLAAIALRVLPIDLPLALPVGLWLGLVLFGLGADRSPRFLLGQLRGLFALRSPRLETARLARLLSALVSLSLGAGLTALAVVPIFGRIVRAHNAAVAATLAALAAAAFALSMHATVRLWMLRALKLREWVLGRFHGLVSVPSLLLAGLVATAVGLTYLAAHGDQIAYALDLAPLWWLLAYAVLLALAWALTALSPVDRALRRLAHPLTFTLSNVALAVSVVLSLQLIGEVGAHAGLLDGTGVASRVYNTFSELREVEPLSSASDEIEPLVEASPPARPNGSRAPDIVLISVDTLRADHLGLYGYTRSTSPNLDLFAHQALTFDRVYSAAPCTSSSFAGLLTSRLPSRIPGAKQKNEQFTVPASTPSFVEHLRQAGYQTRGLIPLVPQYLPHARQGFETLRSYFGDARRFTSQVIAALHDRDPERPLFLWAHYLSVHYPYDTHPGWSDFGDQPIDRYDQEIAYTDQQLARVFAQLQWAGLLDSSIVVFTADHGEAFGEHGTRLHGDNLYEEQIRVPLLIAAPGLPRGARFATRVSLLDLGPTLVDLAGVDRLPYKHEGRSLLARIKGLDTRNPSILVDSCRVGTQFALIGDHKLYYRRRSGAFYLYDLGADPGEKENLFALRSDLARPLVRSLRREMSRVGSR